MLYHAYCVVLVGGVQFVQCMIFMFMFMLRLLCSDASLNIVNIHDLANLLLFADNGMFQHD